MSGLIMLIAALTILPRLAAFLVAGFLAAYAVKIIVEELGDPEVPDSRKAIIVIVTAVALRMAILHPGALKW